MNTNLIIENAAKRAGLPLPLDDETREFSEGFLRSLKCGLDIAHGRRNPSGRDFFANQQALIDEAEALRNGRHCGVYH